MKQCKRCRVEKSEAEFNKSKSRADGLNHWCKECHRAAVNRHYSVNRRVLAKRSGEYKAIRRNAIRQRLYDYLLQHPCVDCGEPDPVVLEFDHVRGQKRYAISNRAFSVVPSWDKLMVEISKCDVRCANCHRRKTAHQLNWWVSGLADTSVVQSANKV